MTFFTVCISRLFRGITVCLGDMRCFIDRYCVLVTIEYTPEELPLPGGNHDRTQMYSTQFRISPGSRTSQMSSRERIISPIERLCWWQ